MWRHFGDTTELKQCAGSLFVRALSRYFSLSLKFRLQTEQQRHSILMDLFNDLARNQSSYALQLQMFISKDHEYMRTWTPARAERSEQLSILAIVFCWKTAFGSFLRLFQKWAPQVGECTRTPMQHWVFMNTRAMCLERPVFNVAAVVLEIALRYEGSSKAVEINNTPWDVCVTAEHRRIFLTWAKQVDFNLQRLWRRALSDHWRRVDKRGADIAAVLSATTQPHSSRPQARRQPVSVPSASAKSTKRTATSVLPVLTQMS